MDETQMLDCTQALPCDLDDDDQEEHVQHLVAWLQINGTQHEVFTGRNVIGRDPDGCKIVIPSKVLSKQHAAVEVRSGTHTLADLGSSNKTRLGNLVLRPHVQYALQGGEKIRFGNVMATYTIKPEACDDSGSETGSESMLPMMEDEEEMPPSPVLPSSLNQSGTERTAQNGSTSVSRHNSSSTTPQAKGIPPSPSPDTPPLHLTDSLLQASDTECSVVSATQSPIVKTTPLSPPCTGRPEPEDYNSDASTDVEDDVIAQHCPRLLKSETPAHPSPATSIPETPPHSSHSSTLIDTPGSSSTSISIPETPAAAALPNTSNTDTPASSLSITSIPETQQNSSMNTSLPKAPECLSPSTILHTPARAAKDDHTGQGAANDDSVFKKPLAASTLKAARSPKTPANVSSTPKSSAATKECGGVSTRLFPADTLCSVDLDAPTQVFDTSVDLDAPTQVFDTSVDLDAPTQVFDRDTSVDLDAPTQVIDTSVDLDAPTQVFGNDTSVDLDAPTQVFGNDTGVDLDAPTQVIDTSVDLDAPTQVIDTSVDLDAPTQVFGKNTGVDLDAPTQVFDRDKSVDLDAPTQVFGNDTGVDLDAPTQVFTSNAPKDVDLDAPTQVFTSGAVSGVDPNAPTQVFNNDAPEDVDLDGPTQVFNKDVPCDVNPDAPTQVFTSGAASGVDPDAPTQVFTSGAASGVDPDAPTQVFTSGAASGVDPDAPTQVFTSGAASGVDPDAPTQVFNNDAPEDVDLAPTQVFTSAAANIVDPDAPTQVFTSDTPEDVDLAPTQVFNNDAPHDIDPDAPTQVFTNAAPNVVDPDAPTQVFTSDTPEDVDLAPTQVFNNDAPHDIDPDAPTQVFTSDAPANKNDTKDKLDSTLVGEASNTTQDVCIDDQTQELPSTSVKLNDSQHSTNLSLSDDPPSSPTLLADPDDTGAPAQPFPGTCSGGLGISKSIMDVWGRLESNISLGTNAASAGHSGKEDDRDSDAASDASKSLFNEEDEVDYCGEGEAGVSDSPEKGHRQLKEDNYHSDDSTDIEDTLTAAKQQSCHKAKPAPQKESDTREKGRKQVKEDDYHSDDSTDIEDTPTETKQQSCHKATPSPQKENSTVKSNKNEEEIMSEMPSSSAEKEHHTLPGPSTQSTTKDLSQERVTKRLPFTSTSTDTPDSQQSIPANVSLSNCIFDLSEDCSEDVQLTIPRKGGAAERLDWLSDTESEETVDQSQKLFDLPPDTEWDGSQGKESNATATSAKRSSRLDWQSDTESEDTANQSLKLFDLPPDTEWDETQGKDGNAAATPTRRSGRLGSSRGSTPQSNRKRGAITSSGSSASIATPPRLRTKAPVPASPSSTSSSIPNSTPSTIANTTTTPTTSTTTTPVKISVPAPASVPSVSPAPTTRRQTRRGKAEIKTTIPAQSPTPTPISTRRRNKRGIPEGEPCPATTTTIDVTSNTSPTSVTPTSITTTGTTTDTTTTTTTTVTPPQDTTAKRRTRSQRVSAQPTVNTKCAKPETPGERPSPQPSTSTDIDTRSTTANTRTRRGGRRTTVAPVVKIKTEVLDDEDIQTTTMTTTLATIKQEKEDTETSILEQTAIEVIHDRDLQTTTRTTIKQEKEDTATATTEQIIIKVEPQDEPPQEESSVRTRRTRRKPERFSPDRDTSPAGRKLRSSAPLPASRTSGRVLRENTSTAGMYTIQESSATPEQVPAQQRHSQRHTRQQEADTSAPNPEVIAPVVTVKEEQPDPDVLSEGSVASCSSLTPEAHPPTKRGRTSRASTSRGGRAAPSRAAKKIKVEVVPKEEIEDVLETSQDSVTQTRTRRGRASVCKKEPNTRLSQASTGQRAKRSNSDASDTSFSSTSSRATRSNKDVELWSPSKRQRQASTKPRVLFTGYNDPADNKIVTDLGGKVVDTPHDCTVLVTTGLKRTCKLLSAIGMGHPIVNPNWLTMSKAAGNFVDPWQFLLKDREAEEKFGFCLEDTIKSAANFKLFEGLSMHATPSVQPPPCQMRDIVECAGGDYLHAPPKKYEPQIRIISCPEDKRLWPAFKSLGIPILGMEFILTGLLRHELLLEEFVLS